MLGCGGAVRWRMIALIGTSKLNQEPVASSSRSAPAALENPSRRDAPEQCYETKKPIASGITLTPFTSLAPTRLIAA